MLLVEIVIASTTYRVSNDFLELENFWDAKLISLGSVRLASASPSGGWIQPVYGDLTLIPDFFTDNSIWPPTKSIDITVKYTDTTESAAVTLFTGTAHRESITKEGINYQLYATDDGVTSTSLAFTGTVVAEFTSKCTTLGLTLNSTDARGTSPDTNWSPGEAEILESLSSLASYFSHSFYISGSTLYLFDSLAKRNATAEELTEFDFRPAEYKDSPAYSIFKSGDFAVDGSYLYGTKYSLDETGHTVQANVETALGNVKTLVEKATVVLKAPISINTFQFGYEYTWVDNSQEQALTVNMICRSLTYDFDNHEVVMEGEGTITA